MKKLYALFLAAAFLCLLSFGVYSLIDRDDDVSQAENRGLKQKPEFTLKSFLNGDYMVELDEYYTDQFPLRDHLMPLNTTLNKFYVFTTGGENSTIIIETTGNAAEGGIGSVNPNQDPSATQQDPVSPNPPQQGSDPTNPETPENPSTPTLPTEPEKDPEFDDPQNAQTVNSLMVAGDRAMEIVNRNDKVQTYYAQAVSNLDKVLDEAMGTNVNTYSLLVPSSVQFYGPKDIREGDNTDQTKMIEHVYSQLDSRVSSVDAYSKLRKHMDEYIYFRTDHHWTQLGAYYAYTAYCEEAGLEAIDLDEFETGLVTCSETGATTFLGTLYSNVVGSNATVAATLAANPDTVTYYMPVVKTDATSYQSLEAGGVLYGGYNGITTVARQTWDSYLYMAFIGGDQPIEIIETDVDNDKVVMVLKESYGNAFVPFLTNHYSKVVVVDPRKFNTSSTPRLNLADLAKVTGCTDLIVINYPYMPVSEYYTNRLRALGGLQILQNFPDL